MERKLPRFPLLILFFVAIAAAWTSYRPAEAPPDSPGAVVLNASAGAPLLRLATQDTIGIRDTISSWVTPRRVRTSHLGRGGTLDAALADLGLGPGTRSEVIASLRSEIEVKRLPPETGVLAVSDEQGAARSVSLRAEADRFLRVGLDASGAMTRVERIEIPTSTRVRSTSGRVTSSVHQALAADPHGQDLTLRFADIFQWDVDLLVDPRPGDVVRVVYEVRELGELPEDVPPLGDRPDRRGDPIGVGRILAAAYDGQVARSTAYWVEGPTGDGSYFDEAGRPLQKTFLKSPLNYRRISSGFSKARRHPVTRIVVPHHGVDFAAASGTPVVAAADGRVISVGWEGPLGRAVRLRHGSEYVTVYGHLSAARRGLRAGATVRQNEVIGYVGATGRATGPHLHYTLIHRGRPIDPLRFDNPPVEALAPTLEPALARARESWGPLLDPGASIAVAVADGPAAGAPGA
jgi:murein DD-endopeptidase MepM/ murein hydrolase activator NlpD